MNRVSTSDLNKLISKKDYIIIDIRPIDAYNGWRLKGEKRGGHIKGARSLPFKWSEYIDWIEIVHSKGIKPFKKLIIYGYDEIEIEKIASQFELAGYKDVFIYPDFVNEWSANQKMPMDNLKRFNNLVPAVWLNKIISENSTDYEGNNLVICHAHYRNLSDYKEGHIPGAIALNTLDIESPETWNRRNPEELEKALNKLGINSESTVVLYGRFSYPDNDDPFPGSSAGHLGAIRCAAIMLYAGVKDVRILNGGLQSWEDDGYHLTKEESKVVPLKEFGATIPMRPELMIDIPEAKELINSDKGDIVSVRSWNEWIGEVSGYNYIEKKGRIPGAIFGNCGTDAYHMENYRNLDHTCREFYEIIEIWKEVGIISNKQLAFYCGTGWRGSEAFLNAWLMGWKDVSVFDGGWYEWGNDPNNPIETGVPE